MNKNEKHVMLSEIRSDLKVLNKLLEVLPSESIQNVQKDVSSLKKKVISALQEDPKESS